MAKYFRYFPKTIYNLDGSNSLDTVTNLTASFSFDKSLAENSVAYYQYTVPDGETPEIVANKFYGGSEKHWIILKMNNIFDVKTDWPIEQRVLNEVIRSKYADSWITETFEMTDEAGNLFVTEAISTITSLNVVNDGSGYANGNIIQVQGGTVFGVKANATVTTDGTGNVVSLSIATANVGSYLILPSGTVATSSITGAGTGLTVSVNASVTNDEQLIFETGRERDGLEWAILNNHSFYKIETRLFPANGDKTIQKIQITEEDYNSLVEESANYTLSDGNILTVSTTKTRMSFYDYEVEKNDIKRRIKILKSEYVPAVDQDFVRVISNVWWDNFTINTIYH